MGYAMFCSRKIMIVSQIDDIQYRLTELTMKQQDLAAQSSAIQAAYQNNITNNYNNGAYGTDANGNYTGQANYQTDMTVGSGSIFQEQAKGDLYKINQQEKMIEMESKRLQTQLQAKQSELEAVEKGEEQGIKNATPKYA